MAALNVSGRNVRRLGRNHTGARDGADLGLRQDLPGGPGEGHRLLGAPHRRRARWAEQISQLHLLSAWQVDRNEIRLLALCCIVNSIHHSIP